MRLSQVTFQEMVDLYDIQSGQDVEIDDLSWVFIITPQSLIIGGTPGVKPPSYVIAADKPTWECHEYQGMEINCAAFAIAYATFTGTNRKRSILQIRESAAQLQHFAEWPPFISLEDFNEVINVTKDYRVVILNPAQPFLRFGNVLVGEDYVYSDGIKN